MFTTQHPDDRGRRLVAQGFMLGLLVLIVLAFALLALTIPEVMVELPVTPTSPDFPISPHAGF
jgi:hypothetical protein